MSRTFSYKVIKKQQCSSGTNEVLEREKKTERAFNVFKFHSVRILQQWWINCFHECFFCELPSKVVSFKRLILFEGLPQPPHIPRDESCHLCACVGGIYANGSYSKVEGEMEVRRKLLWNWMSRGFFSALLAAVLQPAGWEVKEGWSWQGTDVTGCRQEIFQHLLSLFQ